MELEADEQDLDDDFKITKIKKGGLNVSSSKRNSVDLVAAEEP